MRTALAGAAVVLAGAACTSSTDTDPIEVCFVRGTRVRTPSGTKAIEELAIGDAVLSFDPATMAIVVRHVTQLHAARAARVHTITVAGRSVRATDAHPFWEAEKRAWIPAAQLARGSVLALFDGAELAPRTIDAVREISGDVEVFNITVEGPEHTYFAEDIAVHNKSIAPTCCSTPDSFPGPGIRIQNDSDDPIDLGMITLSQAMIDERLLTRKLDLELPEDVIDAPMFRQLIVPNGGQTIVSPIQVVQKTGTTVPLTGAILDVGGETALYVGNGVLRTRRVDGVLQLVPQDATKIRMVRISKSMPFCASPKSPLKYDSLSSADMSTPHKIGAVTRDADGCTTVRLESEFATIATHQIQFCTAEEAWPFTAGDTVYLKPPILLGPAPTGIRLERADKRAFEVAVMDFPGTLPFDPTKLKIEEDTSCVLPIDRSSLCRQVRLRGSVIGAIELPNGRAWVAGTTSAPISFDCATLQSARIAIVARSP